MSKTPTVSIWILAAVVGAAIANPGSMRTAVTGANPLAEDVRTATAGSSPGHQSSEDDDIDTLQTIGDSVALDLSTDGLKRRAAWSRRQLQRAVETQTAPPGNAVRFFKAFLALPIRPSSECTAARKAVDALDGNPEDKAALATAAVKIDAFLSRYFDTYALTDRNARKEDVLLARDFDQMDKSALQLAILEDVVNERKIQIHFLLATLPDPIDSYTGWQFDPMLDAIAQAAGASDYMLDRFHFPDSDKEDTPGSAAARGRLHELEPGVVVFKKHVEGETSATSGSPREGRAPFGDRLVLLIVHENPAAGVHARALANAIRLVIRSRRLTRDRELEGAVAILGPTFSGSSETLNRALRMASTRNRADCESVSGRKCRVRIVSGSATDRQNKKTIEDGLAAYDATSDEAREALEVTFQATVNPDNVLVPALVSRIAEAEWSPRAALLFEGNTQYGRQVGEILSPPAGSTSANRRFSFIQLPFPMNISRIRTTLDAQKSGGPSAAFGLPSRFRPVPMENEGNPLDQIPQFNPKTTATYMELALAGTLKTVRREQVKTVGLMATDPRDKLFLAQQIARYAPDVSIFTAESDSVYVHPDYTAYLRGALVASTYPLYGANQRWSYAYQGSTERRQFANGSAEGIYNATLALLDYDERGLPTSNRTPRLLEYGMPGKRCTLCTPPVWISIIGQLGAWPVRAYLATNMSGDGTAATPGSSCAQAVAAGVNDPCEYVFAVKVTDQPVAPPGLTMYPSPAFNALLIFMTGAILVSWAVHLTAAARRRNSFLRIDDIEPGRRAYLLVCLLGVLLVQSFIGVLCLLRVRVESTSAWSVATLVFVSLGLLAAGHMTIRVLAAVLRDDRRAIRRALPLTSPATMAAVAAGLVCVWSVGNIALYLKDQALQGMAAREWGDVISFLSRAFDFGDGVSPTLPVLFLGSAVTFWGLIELWRVRRGPVALSDPEVHSLLQKAVYTDVKTMTPSWELLNRSMLRVPPSGIAIAAFVLLASCTFAFDPIRSWLVSIEGPRFGRFVSATLLAVQVMLTLALVQFAFLWSRIKRLLDFMAYHELADAYEHVPRDVFPVTIFPRAPRLADLKIPVAHCAGRDGAASAAEAHAVGVRSELSDLEKTFRGEMRATPDRPWASSETWKALLHGALQTEGGLHSDRMLGSDARVRLAQMAPSGSATDLVAKAVAEIVAADRALQQREAELPAMLIAFVVRDGLARLAANLIFVIGGVVLAFCSHTLFPFQQHTSLQILAWIYIGVTFTTILTVLVQIKRNEIVARLTSPSPGVRTTWDSGFVLKLAVFALLPLLALFAAQFPDVGGMLLRLMEPVQRALP